MRIKFLLVAIAVSAVALTSQSRACSQCMCGTPFPSDALGGVVPTQLRYGLEERYLSKTNALDEEPGTEEESEHRISGFALWRAHDRLALLGRLPYNRKSIESTPEGDVSSVETSNGLGDAELSALVGVAQTNSSHPMVVGLVLGVIAPTGSSSATKDGVRLDAHLQPGTGAWSGSAGVNLAMTFGGAIVDGSLVGRLNGTNSHNYHYGDVLLYNAGYLSPSRHGVRFMMQINGRSAERDQFEDGTDGEHTGGTVFYLSPGARWNTGIGVQVDGLVQIPVVENLFGIQDEHTTGRIALSLAR